MSFNNRQTKCMVIEIRRMFFWGEYGINSKDIREPSALLEMFYILIWVAVTLVCVLYVCVCARVYLVVNLKFVCFTILYLNKRINTSLKPQRKKLISGKVQILTTNWNFQQYHWAVLKKCQSNTQMIRQYSF